MNDVQSTYAPPRLSALILGGIIFVCHFYLLREGLDVYPHFGNPVPIPVAIGLSLIMGYGFAMLGWLILRTKGQVWATFKPSLGRLIGAFCLAMVAPLTVFSYVPWVFGGLIPFVLFETPLWAIGATLLAVAITYPLSAMIVRHTYDRRLLRLGLFCLAFWTAYAGHMLYSGVVIFRL